MTMKYITRIIISIILVAIFLIPTREGIGATYSFVFLSRYKAELNIGEEFYLKALSTSGSVSFRSSSRRVASVSSSGLVTARKNGTAKITATSGKGSARCSVTVKKTSITLSTQAITLENSHSQRIRGQASNGSAIVWRSSKNSVATISDTGLITACKPGRATITASADGTKVTCKVFVKKPTVTLNKKTLSLTRDGSFQLKAKISSGLEPVWKSTKQSVAMVDENGLVTAIGRGCAVIKVSIDGITRICKVTVK